MSNKKSSPPLQSLCVSDINITHLEIINWEFSHKTSLENWFYING